MHPEECLICKAPLEYLVRDEDMECAICHKKIQQDPVRQRPLCLQ
ncbi:MAG: hypothetical protein ACLTYN_13100 [Dysosmobacter welbionis]